MKVLLICSIYCPYCSFLSYLWLRAEFSVRVINLIWFPLMNFIPKEKDTTFSIQTYDLLVPFIKTLIVKRFLNHFPLFWVLFVFFMFIFQKVHCFCVNSLLNWFPTTANVISMLCSVYWVCACLINCAFVGILPSDMFFFYYLWLYASVL